MKHPPRQGYWAVAFAALSAYVLMFFVLYPRFREGTVALSILPVAVIAWFGGARAGLLAGVLSFPANTLLLNLVEPRAIPWGIIIQSGGGPGSVAILLTGLLVGLLRDRWNQIAQEFARHQQLASAVRESEQRYRTLFESSQRQAQELALLDRVRQALARELELPLVFRTVVEGIAETFGYKQVSLYLVEGDVLALQHQVGYEHVIERIPLRQGITGRVVRSQKPVLVEEVQNDPAFLGAIEGITSEVCVPLFDQGQVAGVLNVESTQGVKLSEADLQLMISLGEQIGIALGRARLYADVRESEQRFRQLAEHIEQVFWLEDPEHSQLTYASPSYEVIWGRTRQSLYEQQDSWFEAIHPDDQERVRAAQVRKVRGEYDIEYRVIRPDGSMRWVWSRAFLVRDEHGQVYRIAGIAEDITERKMAEEKLAASESRYRLATQATNDVIWEWSATTQKLTWTENAQYVFGYAPDEIGPQETWWDDHIHPEDRQRVISKLNAAVAGIETIWSDEYRFLLKDGSYAYISDHGYIERDTSGEAIRMIGAMSNVTERVQAEDALRQSEERFKLMAWATKDAVWDWDLGTNQVWWGEGLQKIFHYSSELTQTNAEWWFEHIHPEDQAKVTHTLNQALDGGMEFWSKEYRFQRKDGSYADIMDRGYILRDETNKPYRMIGAMMDITERKYMESNLLDANEQMRKFLNELQQRNREIALLNEMSHLLQACQSEEEAYQVIADLSNQLFPRTAGALYLLDPARTLASAVASWGDLSPAEQMFAPDDCWSLRRGHTHPLRADGADPRCPHLSEPLPAISYCLPMQIQGEVLGLLHVQSREEVNLDDGKRQLAYTVVEQAGMALSNLRLRGALRDQSIRDPLTGLYNRRYLEEALRQQLRRVTRQLHPVAIIMIDIDHFKDFNDAHGHAAGDKLLRELAQLLQSHIRGEDIACRYGGEEFILIVPDISLEVAQGRAEHLRQQAIELQVQDAGTSYKGITLSLGVALYPLHGRTIEDVLRAADAALYRAKQAGRDRVMVAE